MNKILNLRKMPVISIAQGKLRGYMASDVDGEKYYSFQGIPYAKPPIGKLRFKAPVFLERWSGTLDATKCGSPCSALHSLRRNEFMGSENCLFLNVYTKDLVPKRLKPVMFQIYGGGFISGSGCTDMYGPDFLITEDVVIVTINYRVGVLGFLSLEDPAFEVPGNAGFKDVVMALKWVQSNIEYFGGDPNNVTVMGQSCGGSTVHLLMISKMSRGLFHKAIAQSGCALHTWAEGTKGVGKIADLIGAKFSEREVYRRLMEMASEDINKMQTSLSLPDSNTQSTVGYVVEYPNNNAFLTENPISAIRRGDFENVPFMVGHTTREYMCFNLSRKHLPPGFQTCEYLIPHNLGYKLGSRESRAVATELRRFYFGSDQLSRSNTQRICMESDVHLLYGIYNSVLNYFEKSTNSTFLYRLSLETKLNLMRQYFKVNLSGTVHFDDVGYLFKNFTTPVIEKGSREDIGMRRFVRLWTNFAKYGNPTPSIDDPLLHVLWKPVTTQDIEYLDIGENLNVCSNPEEFERVKFLKNLFEAVSSNKNVPCKL